MSTEAIATAVRAPHGAQVSKNDWGTTVLTDEGTTELVRRFNDLDCDGTLEPIIKEAFRCASAPYTKGQGTKVFRQLRKNLAAGRFNAASTVEVSPGVTVLVYAIEGGQADIESGGQLTETYIYFLIEAFILRGSGITIEPIN